MKKHEIYILTRGRTNFLSTMIESLLTQSISNFEIIVSDNREQITENEEVERGSITKKYPQISYIKRQNCPTIWLHMKECASTSNSEVITILHDDDYLDEDYVFWIQNKLIEYPGAGAVAPNSFIVNRTGEVTGYATHGKSEICISSREELLLRYFSPFSEMHPSFPFYTYRTEILKSSLSNALTIGHYSDIELLIRIIDGGWGLIWGCEKKAYYRVHGENISSFTYLEDRQLLLNYINTVGSKDCLDAYRGWLIFESLSLIFKGTSSSKVLPLIKKLDLINSKSFRIAVSWFIKQIKRKLISRLRSRPRLIQFLQAKARWV